jgi:protein-S-isoprenylcysteine O-methyltransferase Ste14
MKKLVPYLFPSSLLALLVITVYARLTNSRNLWAGMPVDCEMLMIVMYVLWLCYEIAVTKTGTGQESREADRGTREFYGIAQALVILSALMFEETWTGPGPAHAIGLALFASGIAFRVWAIRTLGDYYAHVVRTVDGHRIVDTGPYRLLRHPAYAGNLVAHAGVVLFFMNSATLFIFLFVFLPSIIARIRVEEKALMTVEGYAVFARGRKRLVPFAW